MTPASFQNLTSYMYGDRSPRLWSLLVTVFGELVQEEASKISGSLLRELTSLIGIRPEAVRVALHRLRKDGWIAAERQGRTSVYCLTEWGRAQSAKATPIIYASGAAEDSAFLVIWNTGQHIQSDAFKGIRVASNLLITATREDFGDAFVTRLDATTALPRWLSDKVCDEKAVKQCSGFLAALTALQISLETTPAPNKLQHAALRVLIVHSWRRIILKTPRLPDYVFPEDWCGVECRQRVSHLLTQYPKLPLHALEDVIASDAAA